MVNEGLQHYRSNAPGTLLTQMHTILFSPEGRRALTVGQQHPAGERVVWEGKENEGRKHRIRSICIRTWGYTANGTKEILTMDHRTRTRSMPSFGQNGLENLRTPHFCLLRSSCCTARERALSAQIKRGALEHRIGPSPKHHWTQTGPERNCRIGMLRKIRMRVTAKRADIY
ncbi:hypothetical protein SISSUDRAFT_148847 [Sistotremastrum suecicum HHB10207 ss-3]|uniref:Uncharacterized protein n=1 Tax=Sistotremastrum suecicum HHB10207 ss-3 TaxID=1314776 RepID=A0A166GX36_9AGAM|nr:hypothetical protein SISSUDRAFT_148847 [Sistotremastrum suecicum HHB10207 ss-3]